MQDAEGLQSIIDVSTDKIIDMRIDEMVGISTDVYNIYTDIYPEGRMPCVTCKQFR